MDVCTGARRLSLMVGWTMCTRREDVVDFCLLECVNDVQDVSCELCLLAGAWYRLRGTASAGVLRILIKRRAALHHSFKPFKVSHPPGGPLYIQCRSQ